MKFDVRLHNQDVLMGIFDGHGNGHVVDYVSEKLLDRIIQSKWYGTGNTTKAISEGIYEVI
jgi:serine/threonine protein phosphatase PrpC